MKTFNEKIIDALAEGAREHIGRLIAPLQRRIEELEAGAFSYEGVFEEGRRYRRNQFVTWQGSLWHCAGETGARPGTSSLWRLCVKGSR